MGQKQLPNTIYCDNCQKRIPGNSVYCPFCGIRILKEKKTNVWLIILLTIFAMAVIVGLGLAIEKNRSNQTESEKRAEKEVSDPSKDIAYEEHKYNYHTYKFEFTFPNGGIEKISIPGDEGIVTQVSELNEYKWNEFGLDTEEEKESRCIGDCYLHAISADGVERFSLFWSECPTTYSLGTVSDGTLEKIAKDVSTKMFGFSNGEPVSYKLETLNRRTYLTIWASRTKIENYPDATYVRAYVTYYKGREYIFLVEQLEGLYISSEDIALINGIIESIEFE